jgi:hypothetical protein
MQCHVAAPPRYGIGCAHIHRLRFRTVQLPNSPSRLALTMQILTMDGILKSMLVIARGAPIFSERC